MLREGDHGLLIKELQEKLAKAGFSPGSVDGSFGPATEAAVQGFQRARGLLADGLVGPATAAALGLSSGFAAPPTPVITVSVAARMVPGAPVTNIARHLPLILEALAHVKLTTAPVTLAAIATVRVETGRFEPIDEYISRYNTSPGGHTFDLYDFRHDLGNNAVGDGARYKGRGFVQLTGKANYKKFGPLVEVPDLVNNPDRANAPGVAAALLAAFLKAVEIPLKTALLEDDLAHARRLVNGGAYGLTDFVSSYRAGQRALGLG